MKFIKTSHILVMCMLLAFVSCKTKTGAIAEKMDNMEAKMGIVESFYIATNKTENNTVVGFARMEDGSIKDLGEFKTGGKGTGNIEIFDWGYDETHPLKDGIDPLISEYGVFKSDNNQNIFVVNAGDGTISAFNVMDDRKLKLVDTKAAGDAHPLSITSQGNLVYVASAGTSPTPTPPFNGNLMGYKVDASGMLTPIANSKRDLKARPSCVAFTPDGKFIVVNELVTGLVKVYGVMADGSLSKEPLSMEACPHDAKNGRWLAIPVGFDIVKKGNKNVVLVSEARFLDNKGMLREEKNKVPQSPLYSWQTGSTSSFVIDENGKISLMSGDVYTGKEMEGGQIANCWVEASQDGNTLWAANALSSSISSYTIGDNGSLTLKNETAYKLDSEMEFYSDLNLSNDGEYIYQLIGNKGAGTMFKVLPNGDLKRMKDFSSTSLPAVGTYGMIVL